MQMLLLLGVAYFDHWNIRRKQGNTTKPEKGFQQCYIGTVAVLLGGKEYMHT